MRIIRCHLLILFIIVLYNNICYSQISIGSPTLKNKAIDLGGAIKLTWELEATHNFNFSLVTGIGTKQIDSGIYPSFHTELRIYKGGIGSSQLETVQGNVHLDLITSLQFMVGSEYGSLNELNNRYIPIQHFSEFSATPLLNPYKWSGSISSLYVIPLNNGDKRVQRLGVLNANLGRTISINYYNDGTPFHLIGLGDGEDRYHTGGGFIAYHNDYEALVNYTRVSYHRFTGYSESTFQFANDVQIDFVAYTDREQVFYNQSRWGVSVGSQKYGFAVNAGFYNIGKGDSQGLIHYKIDNAYHPNTNGNRNRKFIGLEYNGLLTN